MDVYAHINYFELKYPGLNHTLDEMFELAAEMGYDGIELRAPTKGVAYTMEECAALAGKYGMKGVTFGGNYNAVSDDPAEREAETKRFIACVETAAGMGTKFLNFQTGMLRPQGDAPYWKGGSAVATDAHWNQVADMLRTVGKIALDKGITLCMETHGGYIHDRARAARQLVDMVALDSVKANLDFVNIWVIGDETEEETLKILGDDIKYVHLKGFRRLADGSFLRTSLAEGDINTFNHLRTLKDMGYKGIIVPECPRPGDRLHFARTDLEYVRSILELQQWD